MAGRSRTTHATRLIPLLLLLALPGLAQAQFDYTVESGTVTITKYNGQESNVVIPDMINGQPVTRIGDGAFSSCESLAHIVIPNSVTSIGRKAFHHCPKLISIWVSRNVTMIGESAFGECASLTSISVDDSNPVYKSSYGVLLNKNLTTLIQCPGGKAGSYTVPETVTAIGAAAFADCRKLTEVYFEGDAPALGDGVFDGTTVWILYLEGTLGWESTYGGMSTAPWVKGIDRFRYIIEEGTATIIRYIGAGGDVIIPSSINGVPVTGIGNSTFEFRADLTSVTIPDSVTRIASAAFLGCYGLTTIAISENVTSIGTYPFAQCWGLTAITVEALNPFYCDLEGVLFDKDRTTLIQCPPAGKSGSYSIPSSVTSIGDNAFEGCRGLTSVTIPERVTSIGSGAFADCSSLVRGIIPDGVTSIGTAAFYGCTNLISVMIPDSVTSIGSMVFYDCVNLTSANIPNGVTEVSSDMFSKCHSLASITIPDGVTRIGDYAFERCGSLTSITIPEGVTSIGEQGFSFCTGLTSITIPNSVSVIGDSAFYWCTGLTSILIPSSVSLIGPYAFSSCTRLTAITVDSLNPAYSSLDGVLFDKNHSTLLQCPGGKSGSYTIPDGVSTIAQGAFVGCTQLSSIIIPASVSTIGVAAFTRCTSLTSIAIPDAVSIIADGSFRGCTSLTSVTIPANVTSLGREAFSGCMALTNITIPYGVISIGSRAFYDCANLSAIYFDGDAPALDSAVFDNTPATIYYYPGTSGWGSTFGGRPTAARIVDPVPFEYTISNGAVTITGYTGSGGYVIIPETINGLPVTSIRDRAFDGCTNLSGIVIPDSVTTIGHSAFYGCSGLTTLTIPEHVRTIEQGAFRKCTGLTAITVVESNRAYSSVDGVLLNLRQTELIQCPGGKTGDYTIPDSVTSIGVDAFSECGSLISVCLGKGIRTPRT